MHDDRETALGMSRRGVLALITAAEGVMLAGRSRAPAGSASLNSAVISLAAGLVFMTVDVFGQDCPSGGGNWPGCWRPLHETPGFHDRASHLGVEHSIHVNPYGGQVTVSSADVRLPGLAVGFGLHMRRTHNSSRLLVPVPVPSPSIHDGPLGLGWTFHYGVLWTPSNPTGSPSARWTLVNGDGSQDVFYVHSFLTGSTQLPITSAGSNPEWISTSMKVLRLVTANTEYEVLTPDGLKYTFMRPAGFVGGGRFVPTRVVDRHGNRFDISYDATQPYLEHPVIDYIEDDEFRRLDFIYNSASPPRLTEVKLGAGGSGTLLASYGYESDDLNVYKLLLTHTTGQVRVTTYDNDRAGSSNGVGSIEGVTLPTGGATTIQYEEKLFHSGTTAQAVVWAAKTVTRDGYQTSYAYTDQANNQLFRAVLTTEQGGSTVRTQQFDFFTYGNNCTNPPLWKVGYPKLYSDSFNGFTKTLTYGNPGSFKVSNDIRAVQCGAEQIYVPQPNTLTENRDGYDHVTTYGDYDDLNFARSVTLPGGFEEVREFKHVVNNTRLVLGLEQSYTLEDSANHIVRKMTNDLNATAVVPGAVNLTRNASTMLISLVYYNAAGKRGAIDTRTVGTYVEDYDYDNGMLQSINYPAGPDVTRTINDIGTIASETRDGYSTTYMWDADLRLTTITPPTESNTTIEYFRNQIKVNRGGALKLTNNYDSYGRLTSRARIIDTGVTGVTATESFTSFTPYDRPKSVSVPSGAVYDIAYDTEERIVSRLSAEDDHTFTYAASAAGLTVTHTQNGVARVSTHDHARRPTGGTLGTKNVAIAYTDIGGNVYSRASVTADDQPASIIIGWNGLGEVASRDSGEIPAVNYTLTAQGWLDKVDRQVVDHDFGFDLVGRVTTLSKEVGASLTGLVSFDYHASYAALESATATDYSTGFLASPVGSVCSNFDGQGRARTLSLSIPRALHAPVITYPEGLYCFESSPPRIEPNNSIVNPYDPRNPGAFEWSTVPEAEKYEFELRVAGYAPGSTYPDCHLGQLVERFGTADTSFRFDDLAASVPVAAPYCVRVRARREAEVGPFSFWKLFQIRSPSDSSVCFWELPHAFDTFECGDIAKLISREGGTGEETGCGDNSPPPGPPDEPGWTQWEAGPDTKTLNYTLDFTYDGEGRVETITHPEMDTSYVPNWRPGLTQKYSFATAGGHESVAFQNGAWNATIISGTDYHASGMATNLAFNYHTSNFSTGSPHTGYFQRIFDTYGRVQNEKAYRNDAELYDAHTFAYTPLQLVETYHRDDTGLSADVAFGYDTNRRLMQYTIHGQAVTYGWDNAGNLTSKNAINAQGLPLPTWNGTAPPEAGLHLSSIAGQAYTNNRRNGAIYDADGKQTDDGTLTYYYNDLLQVKEVTETDGWVVAQYVYDAHGNRVREVYEDRAVYSIRAPGGRLMSREVHAGASANVNVFGLPLPHKFDLVYHNGVHVASLLNLRGEVVFPLVHHRNFLGHPVVSLGHNHSFTPEYLEYSPFGTQMRTERYARTLPTEFAQYEYDAHTDSYYAGARYYDPVFLRFNQPDPDFDYDLTEAGSFDLYSFVRGNPVAYRDPSGRVVETALVLVVAPGLATWAVGGALVTGAVVVAAAGSVLGSVGWVVADQTLSNWALELSTEGNQRLGQPEVAEALEELDHATQVFEGKLPQLDSTGKVHGPLPEQRHFSQFGRDELIQLQDDLRKSVQRRIEKTVEMGPHRSHGQRQAAEQRLIRQIDKYLED